MELLSAQTMRTKTNKKISDFIEGFRDNVIWNIERKSERLQTHCTVFYGEYQPYIHTMQFRDLQQALIEELKEKGYGVKIFQSSYNLSLLEGYCGWNIFYGIWKVFFPTMVKYDDGLSISW